MEYQSEHIGALAAALARLSCDKAITGTLSSLAIPLSALDISETSCWRDSLLPQRLVKLPFFPRGKMGKRISLGSAPMPISRVCLTL